MPNLNPAFLASTGRRTFNDLKSLIIILITIVVIIIVIVFIVRKINSNRSDSSNLLMYDKNNVINLYHSLELYGNNGNENPNLEYVRWYCKDKLPIKNSNDELCKSYHEQLGSSEGSESKKENNYIDIENIGFTQLRLADFHIMSSYNTCVISNRYKNAIVSLNGLKNAWKCNAKFFDFEVYTIDNKVVIGCNTDYNNFSSSSSKNKENGYLLLSDAFEYLSRQIVELGSDFVDPIIIHIRMKTKIKESYDKVANMIQNIFKFYLYPYKKDNPGNILLSEVLGKVLICCHILPKNIDMFSDTSSLYSVSNIFTGCNRDISLFDIKKTVVHNMVTIFEGDENVSNIINTNNINKLFIHFPKLLEINYQPKYIYEFVNAHQKYVQCVAYPYQLFNEETYNQYLCSFQQNIFETNSCGKDGKTTESSVSYKQRLPKAIDWYIAEYEYNADNNIAQTGLTNLLNRVMNTPSNLAAETADGASAAETADPATETPSNPATDPATDPESGG